MQSLRNISTSLTYFFIIGCVAKVQQIENWIVFGEVLLQLIIMQSAEAVQKLPLKMQRIVFDPSRHDNNCQGDE